MQKNCEWFFRLLAEGDPTVNEDTLWRFSEEMGLNLRGGEYFCIALQYLVPMWESTKHVLRLHQELKRASAKSRRVLYTFVGKNLSVVAIVRGKGGERERFCTALYRRLSSKGARPLQMGVGRSFSQLIRLSSTAAEAYEALGNRHRAEIRYIDDIYATRSLTAGKTEPQMTRVLECFRRGNLDDMMEVLSQLCEFVRSETPVREGRPYPTSIRRTVLELLLRILYICSEMGLDTEEYLEGHDPYAYIFQLPNTPSILNWFESVARRLYDALSDTHGKRQCAMISEAMHLVAEHLSDADLCLTFVSDSLGITPSYFSTLFIQEMGIGFTEYVTRLRLDQAKTLLKDRTVKIGHIASRCGFRSPSYFIAVFRKDVGMSPGEYRRSQQIS